VLVGHACTRMLQRGLRQVSYLRRCNESSTRQPLVERGQRMGAIAGPGAEELRDGGARTWDREDGQTGGNKDCQ
jgi:hypothetical protein